MNAARSRSWFLYLILMPVYFFLGSLFFSVTIGLVALGVWGLLFPILRAILPASSGGRRPGSPEAVAAPAGAAALAAAVRRAVGRISAYRSTQ
jgi:hypothetical protein